MQKGLAQWTSFLADKPLPVLQRTKKDVQDLIDQPQLSIMQYAAPILFDAGFSAQIFRYVNSQRISSGKNPLTTMSNALSHLGQTAFQNFLNKQQLFENLQLDDKHIKGYKRVMGQTCHALFQATDWAHQRHVTQPEEMQIATLLQTIAELMLWCYADDVMPKIEELCYVKKRPYEQAANEVLGCNMRQLGATLARRWSLPEMAQDGLTSKRDDFTLACGVSLAMELAREVGINWYARNAKNVIQHIAKYKGKAEGEIEHRLHLSAVYSSDALLDKGYMSPAMLLPQLADEQYIYSEYIIQPAKVKKDIEPAKTTKSTEVLKPLIASKLLAADKNNRSIIEPNDKTPISKKSEPKKPLTTKPTPRKREVEKTDIKRVAANKQQAIEKVAAQKMQSQEGGDLSNTQQLGLSIKTFQLMVVHGLPAHNLIEYAVNFSIFTGIQRCVFLTKIPNKKQLHARYTQQQPESDKLKSLKISIDKPHVFSLIMEKSRGLFLNDSNRSKYWNSIPDTVKLAIGGKAFFAVSIFVNNHAVGMLYGDKVKGQLTDDEFKQFQGVCRLLSKGIVQSTHNKNKHKKE